MKKRLLRKFLRRFLMHMVYSLINRNVKIMTDTGEITLNKVAKVGVLVVEAEAEALATKGLANKALIINTSTCRVLTRYSDSFSEEKIRLLISSMMKTISSAEDSAQWEWDKALIA
jgi:hypothetical protein